MSNTPAVWKPLQMRYDLTIFPYPAQCDGPAAGSDSYESHWLGYWIRHRRCFPTAIPASRPSRTGCIDPEFWRACVPGSQLICQDCLHPWDMTDAAPIYNTSNTTLGQTHLRISINVVTMALTP